MRCQIINVADQDQQLAKSLVAEPRQAVQDFAAGLIRECLMMVPALATQADYIHSLDALTHLVQSGKATES